MAEKLKDVPPADLGLPADLADKLAGLPPRGYYPGKPRPPEYDYEGCALFRRSGHERGAPKGEAQVG
jgi:hypothetical protein